MNHSPRPWKFDPNPSKYADLVIEDATGNTIAEVNIQASDFTQLDPNVHFISRDEGFANARLIVAAPVLYDALLQALDRLEAMEEDRYSGFTPACEAAIAYARKVLSEVAAGGNPLASATLKNWQVPRTSVNPKYAKDHPVDALAQTLCDAGASAAYRQVAIDAYVANVNANNAAQAWMNRAMEAEEEIREGGRGIDLREGFER